MYLVLNLATSLVLLQYHCHFDEFFKTTCHNQPNVVTSATWKQLMGLQQADGTLTARDPLENFAKPCRILEECPNPAQKDPKTQENSDNFLSIGEFPHEICTHNYFDNSGNSTENLVRDSEGAIPTNSASPSADTSSCGRQCKMSNATAKSVSQHDFYRDSKMFYMALQSFSKGQTKADLFHDNHLDLQEHT